MFSIGKTRHRIGRVDCGSPHCDYCGDRTRRRDRQRVRFNFGGTPEGGYLDTDPVYATTVPECDYPALKKRMERAGALFMQYPAPDGERTVYSTMQIGPRILDLDTHLQATQLARSRDRRKVGHSANWKQLPAEGWGLDGFITATEAEAETAAQEEGVKIVRHFGQRGFEIYCHERRARFQRWVERIGLQPPGKVVNGRPGDLWSTAEWRPVKRAS